MLPFRSRFPGFPLLPGLVSRAFFPVACTWLSVCFLSPFLASLPQLFRECSPFSVFRLPLGVCPAFPFLSSGSRLGLTTQPLFLPFPTSRSPLTVGFPVRFIRLSFRLFPCFRSDFGTWLSCVFPFSASLFSLHRCYFSRRPPVSSSAVPLAFALGFGYLAWVIHPEN